MSGRYPNLRACHRRMATSRTTRPVELFDQGPFSDDAIDTPGWSDFQAARERFLDRLEADAARRATPQHIPRRRYDMSTTTEPPAIDADKLMAFVYRAVDEVGATLNSALVVIGDKLGLYRAWPARGR